MHTCSLFCELCAVVLKLIHYNAMNLRSSVKQWCIMEPMPSQYPQCCISTRAYRLCNFGTVYKLFLWYDGLWKWICFSMLLQ